MFIKEAVKYLDKLNTSANTNYVNKTTYSKSKHNFAKVLYKHPKGSGEIDVYFDMEESDESDFSLIRNTDGEIEIIMNFNVLIRHSYDDRVIASCIAHELGHLLSGHLELAKPLTAISNSKIERMLLNDNFNADTVQRATIIELLRGGVLHQELEADIIASQFVGVRNIVLSQTLYMNKHNNVMKLEKINRISKLLELDDKELLEKVDCEFKLCINKMFTEESITQ